MRKALKMSLLLGTIAVLFALTACGVDGDYKANSAPEIRITSWEGVEIDSLIEDSETLVFQQRIYWNANDKDGIITGVAYRVLDQNGNPIATPGNSVIDAMGEIGTVVENGNELTGWIVHYKKGADENIPLTSPEAKRTIWSQRHYAVINFPANEDGVATERISSFEVVCIDDRGAVSNIARKSFKTTSSLPTCILSTSRGNPNGKEVGTGLYLTFSMSTPELDPFSVPGADFFEYKLEKISKADTVTVISATEWFNTKGQAKINEVKLTKYTDPALTPDIDENGVQTTFTRVTAHVYNLAGVKSNESIIEFIVKEGLHPRTIIFPQKVYALGDNHYKDYFAVNDQEVYPFITTTDGPDKYATKFFIDSEGRKSAVNSPNLKVYATWGYWGQYGTPPTSSSGATVFSESPYDTEVGHVLNASDNKDYYSEIIAYDIRFDDEPYDFYALSQDPNNIVTHDDGTEWLRVPKNSVWSISKGLELHNIASGDHKLEVSAVDLQEVYDPNHAVLEFTIVDHIPKADRNKILILDASNFDSWSSTQVYADSVYHSVLDGVSGSEFLNRREINAITGLSINSCNLSFSDLQKYKTVIYREEHKSSTYFIKDYDAIKLYLNDGGNIVLSAEKNLKEMHGELITRRLNMFTKYFGINPTPSAITNLPDNSPFINGAAPTDNFPSLVGLPQLNLYLGHTHNFVLSQRKGFIDLAYFAENYAMPEDPFAKVLYRSKAKPVKVGDNFSPQSEEVFERFNNLPIGIAKITPQNKCFVFGFPLSYMEKDGLIQLFQTVLNN